MSGIKRSLLIATAMTSIVSCNVLQPLNGAFYYVWDVQTRRYDPPINTWVENPRAADALRARLTGRSDTESVAARGLRQLQTDGFVCAPRERSLIANEAVPACTECDICIKVNPGYADTRESLLRTVGTVTEAVYIGPDGAVRVLTYWKRPPPAP